MINAVCIGLLVVLIVQSTLQYLGDLKKQKLYETNLLTMTDYFSKQNEKWHDERQQLLDRIQASSFAEYKTAEIKVIKAQSGEKEPPKLEQL